MIGCSICPKEKLLIGLLEITIIRELPQEYASNWELIAPIFIELQSLQSGQKPNKKMNQSGNPISPNLPISPKKTYGISRVLAEILPVPNGTAHIYYSMWWAFYATFQIKELGVIFVALCHLLKLTGINTKYSNVKSGIKGSASTVIDIAKRADISKIASGGLFNGAPHGAFF